MWFSILVGVGAVLTFAVASLLVPVHAIVDFDTAAFPKLRVRFMGLFGIIRRDVAPREKKTVSRPSVPHQNWTRMLIIPGLPSRFTRLTKAVLWAFRVKELDIDGHFGMGDPFAAGVTFGVISAMRASVKLPANYHIQIVPSFASDIFLEGYAHLDVSVRPVKLLAPAVLFGLSSPGRRLLQLSLFHRESIKIVRHRRLDR